MAPSRERISGLVERQYSVDLNVQRLPRPLLRDVGTLGLNHAVKFSKTSMRHAKNRESKGPSQGVMQNCVLQDEFCGLQYSRKERKTKPCNKYDAPAETHRTWHGISTDSKGEKDTFDSPAEALAMPVLSSEKSEEREFVIDSGASMRMLSKKKVEDPGHP